MKSVLQRTLTAALCAFLVVALMPPCSPAAFAADDGVVIYYLVESKMLEDGS